MKKRSAKQAFLYVGIDLAKDSFDAALAPELPDLEKWAALPHRHFDGRYDDPATIAQLRAWYESVSGRPAPALVVVESTGRMSGRFACALAPWAVAIVNPKRIKDFASSLGQKHKSDRVDAAMIALYAARRAAEDEELRAATRLRETLVAEITAWKSRLGETDDPVLREMIEATIAHLEKQRDTLEERARKIVDRSKRLAKQIAAIQKIPGIKRVVAPTLTAELGDLASYDRGALCAAAGLFPVENQSGSVRRRSRLAKGAGGRARRVLHMGARSLFRSKGPLREHIEWHLSHGKTKACVLGIMMRKLLLIARAVMVNGGVYDPAQISFARA